MLWWCVFVIGWIFFAAWAWQLLPLFPTVSRRSLARQSERAPALHEWPRLTVIVPARDEGPNIGAGLKSLLKSDYPDLEVIAVDDRSTDQTGAVMDELAATDPRLRVIHIRELPDGWLGKNHAMFAGQQQASGAWLLFTDGDVIYTPDALRRSIRYAVHEQLDHLTMFPYMIPGGYWENAVVVFFSLSFMAGTKPYLVRDPRATSAYVGIGAFNLVRRSAYDRVGGHQPLAMEILDDVRLGQMFKHNGLRCDILAAGPAVSVRWQHSLWGTIRGLEKNGFAALHFSTVRLIFVCATILGGGLLPYIIPWFVPDWRASGYLATIVLMHVTYGYLAYKLAKDIWLWPAFPVALVMMTFAFARSGWITLRQGGVRWRDTFYPLAILRTKGYRPEVNAPVHPV